MLLKLVGFPIAKLEYLSVVLIVADSVSHLSVAQIDWSNPAVPLATAFDDFYFSIRDGIAESEYVFLDHNRLVERWQIWPSAHFCVVETGFGTGLNLLLLWRRFLQFRQQHPEAECQRLHFVSFEKHPLTRADLIRAHQQWPELAELAAVLQQVYPYAVAGCHRLLLSGGQIVVDLWFGDLQQQLPQLERGHNGIADAWFLDGFSPTKNPAMWQPELYQEMARLSRPEATVATFTAASLVRKGLQAHGFIISKAPGFGKKREMLFGHFAGDTPDLTASPYAQKTRPFVSHQPVAVIGAGIAGASMALALVRRGLAVTLFCADSAPAMGASGNRQGALYPQLNAGNDALAQWYQQSFGFARQFYAQLMQRYSIDHDWCGVLQLPVDEPSAIKLQRIANLGLDPQLVHWVEAEQATTLAGVTIADGGLFYPDGGWVSPQQLTQAMIDEINRLGGQCHFNMPLQKLVAVTTPSPSWALHFAHGQVQEFAQVIVAGGAQTHQFEETAPLPLNPVRGQIAYPAAQGEIALLQTVLCANGYLVPALVGQLTCGASFGRGDTSNAWRQADLLEIINRMTRSFGQNAWSSSFLSAIAAADNPDSGRASVRAAVRDHWPVVGAVPDWQAWQTLIAAQGPELGRQGDYQTPLQSGLYVLTGLGSRGLCSAPLAAELLASKLLDEPQPLSAADQARLAPERFGQRQLNKGQPLKL